MQLRRSEQDKANEYRPQGVYTEVHNQGGTEFNAILRCLSAVGGSKKRRICAAFYQFYTKFSNTGSAVTFTVSPPLSTV